MRLRFAVVAVLVIAEQASLINGHSRLFSKAIADASKALLPQPHTDEIVRRAANTVLAHALDGAPSTGVATPVVSSSIISARSDDPGTWEKDTELSCQNALSKVNVSSISPSGMSACYNIRYFDNSTSVFQSELRFYRLAPPAGNWTMLDSKRMRIGISCKGASLAQRDPVMRKRDGRAVLEGPALKAPRRARYTRRSNTPSPQPLQVLQFVGKLHDDQRGTGNYQASVRSSLIPIISLSGITKDGTELKTELSPQDASFLNGAFADNQTKAFPSSPNSGGSPGPAAQSSGGSSEFLMPGRKLGIFPVGFVITMIWTFFFVVFIGLGTFDRIRFREAYRRRLKRERTIGMRMI